MLNTKLNKDLSCEKAISNELGKGKRLNSNELLKQLKTLNEQEFPTFGINPELPGHDNSVSKINWKFLANDIVLR